ncbi:MAG: hypothetical protein FWE93_05160 [Alphaproteobacteria bacterium]|nr:hypothetical protein [Alphaproteobacteria bacterium]
MSRTYEITKKGDIIITEKTRTSIEIVVYDTDYNLKAAYGEINGAKGEMLGRKNESAGTKPQVSDDVKVKPVGESAPIIKDREHSAGSPIAGIEIDAQKFQENEATANVYEGVQKETSYYSRERGATSFDKFPIEYDYI